MGITVVVGGHVIPTSAAARRPPPPTIRRRSLTPSPFRTQSPNDHTHHEGPIHIETTRRSTLLLLLFPLSALIPTPAASAASFGIPGPKEWLRDQKKKAARFVLAPIDASRQSLQAAFLLLTSEPGNSDEDSGEVQRLLNSASRDCIPQSRSSLVAFQAGSGVEVCTFRLIVNNAASLLDKSDPVKLGAEAMLDDLIRSFSSLSSVIANSDFQLTSDREKMKDGLTRTISVLDKFEQGIKDCLSV